MSIPFIDYTRSHRLKSVDSTNTYCKSGKVQFGEWVLAENQTNGRGRKEKVWESLGIGNIFFSSRVPTSIYDYNRSFIISQLTIFQNPSM